MCVTAFKTVPYVSWILQGKIVPRVQLRIDNSQLYQRVWTYQVSNTDGPRKPDMKTAVTNSVES